MQFTIQRTISVIILAALAAGCSPLFQEREPGLAPVSICLAAPGEAGMDEGARTLMPAGTGAVLFYSLRLSRGDMVLEETIDAGLTKTVYLGSGAWNLLVYGYGSAADRETGAEKAVLSGAETFTAPAGSPVIVTVNLAAVAGSTVTGTFTYSISFPDTVSYGLLTLVPLGGGSTGSRDLLTNSGENTVTSSGSGKTADGSFTLLTGYYRLGLELYDVTSSLVARKSEILHIYGGMTSTAAYTLAAANFSSGPVNVPYDTSLPVTLAGILAGSAGEYVVELPADETCPPMNLSTTGAKQFVITIRGNGHTLDLVSAGSLFTVGSSASGSWKVSLALQNITLRGKADNTAPLVSVQSKGTLSLETGAVISGNVNTSTKGGGVSVSGGDFTMKGGEISGNTARDCGGGVYIYSKGTFTMTSGKISGNTTTAATADTFTYGGGVYIDSRGTFTMKGGEISGNSAAGSTYCYGGGVTVDYEGDFTMSGGKISGNTALTEGGGVYVYTGAFTMYDGEISGNSTSGTSFSCGGGVSVFFSGDFIMSGGKISHNTAFTQGGGVYSTGSFAMHGGEISGNTAAGSTYCYGGGVYIGIAGTFDMDGGRISGNTAAGTTRGYGGGVYVVHYETTFTMSGGARVMDGHVFLDYNSVAAGQKNASITIGGAFTGDLGPIAGICFFSSFGIGKNVLLTSPPGGLIDQSLIGRFPLVNADGSPMTSRKIATDGTLAQP